MIWTFFITIAIGVFCFVTFRAIQTFLKFEKEQKLNKELTVAEYNDLYEELKDDIRLCELAMEEWTDKKKITYRDYELLHRLKDDSFRQESTNKVLDLIRNKGV